MADKECAQGFEVYCDTCYYDLWAEREVGSRSFCDAAHFMTRDEVCAWTHNPTQKPDPRFN